ncbi:MAG: tetratricopeptide repeat protein, partial [Candidatus Obscuribacterales bacterium]|nr:tetratricopeptide repeat protein [Candidatus Obscuribacterales bacterium]
MSFKISVSLLMAFSFSILSGLGNLQARAEQKDPQLYFKLGWSYYDRGQFSKAISAFDKAIELRPGNMEYLLSRGDTFDRIERYDRAFLDYRRVLKVKPVTAEQFY